METLKKFFSESALAKMVSSERVIGALLLFAILAASLYFTDLFVGHEEELTAVVAALVAQFIGLHTYVKISGGVIVLKDDQNRPLLEPLGKLWKSRKFMVTLIGMLLQGAVMLVPYLEPYRAQLQGLILMAVVAYNGAIAVEDKYVNAGLYVPKG